MIEFKRFTFSYGDSAKPALQDVSLTINDGEFLLLKGLSGSGKSTLLKAMNGLVPHFYGGKYGGEVIVDGLSVRTASVAELGGRVGLVFQDSSSQIVAETVAEEIAFGPANMGLPADEINSRVTAAARMMRIDDLLERRTATLSGGEKQKTAIAAVLSMKPKVIALDEPFAELDSESADDLLSLLVTLHKDEGLTVILAEHRVEKVLEVVDRVVEVEDGRVVHKNVIASEARQSHEGNHLAEIASSAKIQPSRKDSQTQTRSPAKNLVTINNLSFGYNGRGVLEGFDMSVDEGEIVALTGPNGCGKTTLLRLMCGFLAPSGGEISVAGLRVGQADRAELFKQIGYVPQRPSALLFAETVEEEVYGFTTDEISRKKAARQVLRLEDSPRMTDRPDTLLEEFGLEDAKDAYPRDLSWGQQQRVALAAVLYKQPKVILLDEPTHGLDSAAKERLAELLISLAAKGAAIIIATHDSEMAAMTANRIVQLSN